MALIRLKNKAKMTDNPRRMWREILLMKNSSLVPVKTSVRGDHTIRMLIIKDKPIAKSVKNSTLSILLIVLYDIIFTYLTSQRRGGAAAERSGGRLPPSG